MAVTTFRLERENARSYAAAARVVAVAVCMVIPIVTAHFLIGQSLRLDEAQSLWQTSRSVPQIFSVVAGDVHVPLYHLLLHAWRLYVGSGIAASRLLSLLFFVLSIPIFYLLGALVYDARTALFATLLFAFSPFMNWYANEIRMYTLLVFFTIANQYFFVRLFKDTANGSRAATGRVWAGYALTAVLGAFTHYFFLLNLLIQAIFYGSYRTLFPTGAFKRFVLVAALVVGMLAPWVWYVVHVGAIGFEMPSLTRPTTIDFFSALTQFFFGFQDNATNAAVLSLWPLSVLLGVLAIKRRRWLTPETMYFIFTVALSFIVTFGVSLLVTPVFESRYLIFTIPTVYLLISSMFFAYVPWLSWLARTSIFALMFVALAVEIVNPMTSVKENYADAVAYLNAHATAQDAILLSAPFTIYPVQYYYHGPATVSTLPMWNQYAHGPIPSFSEQQLPAEVASLTVDDQNVYLLLSYNQGYEQNIKEYFDSHYERLYAYTFSHDLSLYVYRLRYNTDKSAVATNFKQ